MMKKFTAGIVLLTVLAFVQFDAAAQSIPSFLNTGKARERNGQPTDVEAATMDLDIANNMITLLGNVNINDQDMNIKCNKMIIYLSDKEEEKDGDKEKEEGGKNTEIAEGKQLSKIECIGDVIITRRADDSEMPDKAQTATADKAVYDPAKETIELIGKPILSNGPGNQLHGDKIIVNLKDGGRMMVIGVKTTMQAGDNSLFGGNIDK